MEPRRIKFRHSLQGRLLLFLVLPIVVISFAGIMFRGRRAVALVREQAQRQLENLSEQVAGEVERGNMQAVLAVQMMAFAQEESLFGRRAESSELARRVLEQYPEFTGAYFGYEPNADQQDAEYVNSEGASAIGSAFTDSGRFIPYWYRDQNDPTLIKLEPLVDMETSLYYDGCRRLFETSGTPQAMITEPYVYEGKLIVEQTFPITIDGQFMGVAGVDRALSDIAEFLKDIKLQRHADVYLVSSRGRFIATTLDVDLQTRDIQETTYRDLFDAFYVDRRTAQFRATEDPIDGEDYCFATAHIPTGDWLVVVRESESHIVGPLYASVAYTSALSGCLLLIIIGIASLFVTTSTGRIRHAMQAAERVASGDLGRELNDPKPSDDEIGSMFESLNRVIESYRQFGDVCAAIAAGDFSRRVTPRSEQDELAVAINQMVDARQQAESDLAASEERSRLLLESPREGIIGVDTEGVVTFVNASGAATLGYEKSELLGKGLHPLVHHTRRDGTGYPVEDCPMYRAFSEGIDSKVDDEVLWRKNGSRFEAEYSSVPIRQSGQIVGAVIVFRDITERKQAEATFRILFEQSSDAHLIFDGNGIVDCNNAAVELLGCEDKQKLIGMHPADFSPDFQPDGKRSDEKATEMDTLARANGFHRFDWIHRKMNGTEFPVEVSLTPVDLFGKSALIVVWHDLTERKQMEEEIRRVNFLSDVALELTGCGYWHVDYNDPEYYYQSDRAATILGEPLKPDGRYHLETEWFSRLIEADREAAEKTQERYQGAIEGRYDCYESTYGYKRPLDGEIVWVHAFGKVVRDDDGEIRYMYGAYQDITQQREGQLALREAIDRAEEAARIKADFLANMSHEIRTPMNGIIGMTDLALDTKLDSEQRDYLNTVKESANALLMLINDILDFSKIEAGKLELEPIDFQLRDALADMLSTLANRAHSKGLELLFDVQPDAQDAIVGDVYRLRQVIINLVGNAIKFTETGEVVVSVSETERTASEVTLQFAVRDTGIGIPKDRRDAIFRSFEQVDASTTRQFGGSGLGLSISQQLVGLMDGNIWLESELGQGSTFFFSARFGIGDSRVQEKDLSSLLEELSVLVVDDNRTNRRILQKMLTNWGMRPTSVDSAFEAIAAIDRAKNQGTPFQLVLSDVNMPSMDGFTLFERTRSHSEYGSLPFILLTSASRSGDVARCRKMGVSGHLVKPVKQSLLMNTIANTIAGEKKEKVAPTTSTSTSINVVQPQRALRILLAEDNEVNQKFAVRAIEKAGHTVQVANTGREAVEAWKESDYDLILMDLQMPEMDGLQATSHIRETEAAESRSPIPIIAMTANAMKGDRERCLEAGMDGYVSKPVKRKVLFEEIDRLMSGK